MQKSYKKPGLHSILIADDSRFIRKSLRIKLESINTFKIIEEAEDGEDAVKKYKELHPDIVLMDVIMPKKNGLEAIKEIREYDKGSKIIVISSILQQKIIDEAKELGAIHYLIKPFEMDSLIDIISRLFSCNKLEE